MYIFEWVLDYWQPNLLKYDCEIESLKFILQNIAHISMQIIKIQVYER